MVCKGRFEWTYALPLEIEKHILLCIVKTQTQLLIFVTIALTSFFPAIAISAYGAPETKPILNKTNLEGWVAPQGNQQAGWFQVVDGELRVQSGPDRKGGILWTEKEYRDFVLSFDFKFGEGVVDTGIFLRTSSEQIQIGISGSLKRDMTGSPYISGKGYPVEAKGVAELLKQKDWNSMKIKAEGKQYTVLLNGKQVMTYHSESAIEKGPIGIQLHGNRDMLVKFRNVRLIETGS